MTFTKKKPLRKSKKSAGKPPTKTNWQSAIGNPQSPELPLPGLSQPERPIPAFARAEEFLTALTTADLWNYHHEKTPTGAPWFPKPMKSLWHVRSVITGLLARAEHRLKTASAESRLELFSFPSMESCEGATGIPRSFQSTAKENGCPAFRGSRVYLAELVRWTFTQGADGQNVNWTAHGDKFKALNEEVKYNEGIRALVPRDEFVRFIQALNAIYFGALKRWHLEIPRECEMRPKAWIKTAAHKKFLAIVAQAEEKISTLKDEPAESAPSSILHPPPSPPC